MTEGPLEAVRRTLRDWWRDGESKLTFVMAVAAAVVAGFAPSAVIDHIGWAVALSCGAAAVYLLVACARRWRLIRRDSAAVVVFAPLPKWQQNFASDALRYTQARFHRQYFAKRTLESEQPSSWADSIDDLVAMAGMGFSEEEVVEPASTTSLGFLVSAPWPVLWRVGERLGLENFTHRVVVLQNSKERPGDFFEAVRFTRSAAGLEQLDEYGLIAAERRDREVLSMEGDGPLRASIIIETGRRHHLAGQAEPHLAQLQIERSLVLENTYGGTLPERFDDHHQLFHEVHHATATFVRDTKVAAGARGAEFWVFANPTQSLAFALGAYLHGAGVFHPMAYVVEAATYVEAP